MSRVCLAERDDGQYEQRAAVKILKRGMDTDLILRHFQMERQILAGMLHLNVARLLDGGVTPGGRPFFVMEYIEGEPIDRYADARQLRPAERLRLFQQVCAAVCYAHQRLVVHRDIKPGNILVTAEGTVKLLDFGIATIVSSEPALGTLSSAQLLTPDFASPEQIRGEPVTTSSDVYSLGVLLYCLLTGRRPYAAPASSQQLVRAICEQEPALPSSIAGKERRRSLSGDLDNIILKALEKDPRQRYSSAEHLSQDIGRYLEGRPVLAHPHTLRYRASKFVGRNKLAVSAAALMIFPCLAGGVGATLWQARLAGIERRRAETGFFETRQLANSLLFELHDAIKDLPGSTAARALIIQRSLKYLDRLAAASPGNPALQLESAEGYKRLGDVQGNASDSNLGDYAAARESYQKAVALLRQPVADAVLDRRRRRLLALTLIRLRGQRGDFCWRSPHWEIAQPAGDERPWHAERSCHRLRRHGRPDRGTAATDWPQALALSHERMDTAQTDSGWGHQEPGGRKELRARFEETGSAALEAESRTGSDGLLPDRFATGRRLGRPGAAQHGCPDGGFLQPQRHRFSASGRVQVPRRRWIITAKAWRFARRWRGWIRTTRARPSAWYPLTGGWPAWR